VEAVSRASKLSFVVVTNWPVHEWSGSVRDFHGRDLPGESGVWLVRAREAAVVLGSSQRSDSVDVAATNAIGYEVVQRRTGGGAVLVNDTALWVDVILPRDHPWWTDDVSASMLWLGNAWTRVMSHFAPQTTFVVHTGAMVRSQLSDVICFAGLAPGEVTVGGRKLVGISQRRSRELARFQCVVYSSWDMSWAQPIMTAAGVVDVEDISQVHGCSLADVGITASFDQIVTFLGRHLDSIDPR